MEGDTCYFNTYDHLPTSSFLIILFIDGVDQIFIREEYVRVRDLIRPTCFVTQRHETIETKRKQIERPFLEELLTDVMEDLRCSDSGDLLPLEQRGIWFECDVAEWLKDKIPCANVDALRDRFDVWE